MNFSAKTVCIGIIALSVASLAAVFIGQYAFGLHPCHLCVYQRWPFVVTIALGLGGVISASFARLAIGLSALAFFVNAGIAVFHSGVERKWWAGLEGCSTPDMSGSIEELIARIEATAVTRCDEIAWELFGLSLANYNVLLCAGAGIACIAYLLKRRSA